MAIPPPVQVMLPRHRRLRRWMIRICLSVLLMVALLAVVGFILLSPSELTAEEAETAFTQSKGRNTPEQALQLLGKPSSEVNEDGVVTMTWLYYTHGLSHIDMFHCTMSWNQQGKTRSSNSIKVRIEGWEAWRWRWRKLQEKLGIK